ncbi:hypothetical protein PV646_21085 [Streptomyces sp. ID05-26A]|nr:hypothetical protein [Streptomyces sp. ID05-26A]
MSTENRGRPRTFLWVLLVLAVVANLCATLFSLPIAFGTTSGIIAVSLCVLLVREHLRRRARPTT